LIWCFDTSAFIEPWVRLYPPDVFPLVWEKLQYLSENGTIVAPIDVLNELEKQKDDLYVWAKRTPQMFIEPDRDVMEVFTAIVNDHPNFMKVDSTKSGADPFVIALAESKEFTVVTYETFAKQNAAPKIPNVCSARNVRCAQLVDVLREEGFRM
jgi:Domain of unknown function (DUF4411)